MNMPFQIPNHRLLVIDDNPAIHSDFKKILLPESAADPGMAAAEAELFGSEAVGAARAAFVIDSAFQGQEGLAHVQRAIAEGQPYAVAFVDVRMPPGWDGVETVERIWKCAPDLQIVICTAYSDYSWDEMTKRLGHSDNLVVLKKPFDNVEVLQLAHSLTKKWLLNRQANLRLADLEEMVGRRTSELTAEIARRAQVEESLRTSEERFAKAFRANPVAMAVQSATTQQFVDVNEAFLAVSGYTRADLIGRTPCELSLWQKPELAQEWRADLDSEKPVREREARVIAKTREPRDVLVSLEKVALREEPHLLLLAQDVTERLLLERQLRQSQKLQAIGQLAAGVAHDFNNILTVIQGHAGLLDQFLGKEGIHRKCTEQINKAATRASNLIRQLLMFSRKQVMQFRPLDLNEITANMNTMLCRLVGEHITLEFKPAPTLPAVDCDSGMIEQVLMNLAVNARDAMPNGGSIRITTEVCDLNRDATIADPEPRRSQYIQLSFSDAGSGMDTAMLARLFEPFFTTKAVGKGTGLGLATVYGIIKQHRGWIEVESAVGQGTTFRIFLPPSSQPAVKNEIAHDGDAPKTGTETILVAEDEAPLREMVQQILRTQGYRVLAASSGPEAIRLWEEAESPIHLLLTDMVMPEGMMGGELADRLRTRNPDLKVIYTSGYSPGMAGKELSLCERGNFLPKPYSISKLAQFVRLCLDAPLRQEHTPAPARESESEQVYATA